MKKSGCFFDEHRIVKFVREGPFQGLEQVWRGLRDCKIVHVSVFFEKFIKVYKNPKNMMNMYYSVLKSLRTLYQNHIKHT